MKLEVFTAWNIHIVAVMLMTPCNLVGAYKCVEAVVEDESTRH
jgi:hypothetical protein